MSAQCTNEEFCDEMNALLDDMPDRAWSLGVLDLVNVYSGVTAGTRVAFRTPVKHKRAAIFIRFCPFCGADIRSGINSKERTETR